MSPANHKRHSVEELRSIVAPVAEKYGVDKVYLFGSVARGDYNDNSDYDFYIEADKIKSIFKITGFRLDLRDAIGHEIDVVSTKRIDPEFMNNIMAEGILLYG